MSRVIVPHEPVPALDARRRRGRADEAQDVLRGPRGTVADAAVEGAVADDAPPAGTVHALQRQVADLQRELAAMRTERRRDLATARGLGEALQALRRGMVALRGENEDLRRRLAERERSR